MVEKNYSQLAPIKQTATDLASRVKLLEKTLSTKEQQQKQLSATLAAEDKKRIQVSAFACRIALALGLSLLLYDCCGIQNMHCVHPLHCFCLS